MFCTPVIRDRDVAARCLPIVNPETYIEVAVSPQTSSPHVPVIPPSREHQDFERLFHLGREVVKGVRAGVFLPSRGCWLCHDCEYDQDCREWTGNEEVVSGIQATGQ